MTWAEEVAAGERDVREDLAAPYAELVADVRVVAQETWGLRPMWGGWSKYDRTITLYRPAFDQMPDPENRQRQIRDVILHEFQHVFGHPGHTTDERPDDGWYSDREFTIEAEGGFVVTLPGDRR